MLTDKLPSRQALFTCQILLLHICRVQQTFGKRSETHKCTITNGPAVRHEVLTCKHERRVQELVDVVLQQSILEDEAHDVEGVHFGIVRVFALACQIQQEGQRLVEQHWLVAQGLSAEDRNDRRRNTRRASQDSAMILCSDVSKGSVKHVRRNLLELHLIRTQELATKQTEAFGGFLNGTAMFE